MQELVGTLEGEQARSERPVTPASALWRLSRPQGAFWLSWVVLIGYGFALWDWGMGPRGLANLAAIVLCWWLLNAGSLWLNAALDQDQGEVLFQPEQVTVPRGIERAGYAALVSAVVVALFGAPLGALCATGCALLAVAYSHPRTCWKGHPVLGPLVNLVGYGVLTPMAGAAQTGLPFTWRMGGTCVLLAAWILGAFFAAQVFQQAEDKARGYRTLVVTHGPVAAITAARVLMGVAWGGVVVGMLLGYYPRLCLLAFPMLWLTDRYVVRWRAGVKRGFEAGRWGRQGAIGLHRRMMVSGVVLFWLAYCDYAADFQAGRPAAGWATARGRPDLPIALMLIATTAAEGGEQRAD